MDKEELAFNTLTDTLFGYLADIGLKHTSLEMGEEYEEDADFRELYDSVVLKAREYHENCVQIRSALLSKA